MMPLGEGSLFAGYTVIRLLGAGGMGEVYLVQHPRMPRREALKILPVDVSADPNFRARFTREADIAAALWHPHIVGVHDRGEFEGQLWIAMDYVDGLDLGRLLAHRYPAGRALEEALNIVTAVASALDYAHKRGLLHRDVKPANIMLTQAWDDDQRILLTDFGIARSMDDVSGLTATNMAVGTVAYCAPEQLMGEALDGSTDQYALAATAYHLLTGSQLFPHSNPAVVISRQLNTAPPRLVETHPELGVQSAALTRALSKLPEDRFESCSDFARAFRGAAATGTSTGGASANATTQAAPAAPRNMPAVDLSRRRSRRVWPIVAAAVAVIVLLVAAVIIIRPPEQEQAHNTTTSASTSATPSITFDQMREFVTGYYADLPANPTNAWAKLDGHCQQQTGQQEFFDFWATIQSVAVVSISPRDATSVVARLDYVRRNGQTDSEDRWLKTTTINGVTLLDESGRIGAVQAPPTAAPATTQVLITAAVVNGYPANGYTISPSSSNDNEVFDCDGSPAAIADGVYRCAPSAADADVCWPATSGTLLCVDDPWEKGLLRAIYTDPLPVAKASPTALPFALLLDDGTRCRLRNGGAWGGRDDGLTGAYGCFGDKRVVLSGESAPTINQSQPLWTVQLGPLGDPDTHFPPPEIHTVTTAWFAGD
jgi:serine/threonine protein kinase